MTTSTIAAVIDKLAELQRTITGVKTAFGHDQAPNALREAMLPAFVNMPGEAEPTAATFGRGALISTRLYRMILFVCPVQQPSDVAVQANLVEPFFDRVLAKFKSDIELSGLTITEALYEGDNGLGAIEYAGQVYAGVEFMIRVSRQL